MNRSRKRAIRYDRRKAKATGWRRTGMQMRPKVGHGVGGSMGHVGTREIRQSTGARSSLPSRVTALAEPLRVPLADVLATKGS